MDLINLASNTAGANAPLVPTPQALTVNDNAGGGYVTWRYGLSTDNESGDPACGTVTVRESGQNAEHVAGVTVDMAAVQQAVLTNVLNGDIRTQVASVAQNLWQNKTAAALTPLQGVFNTAVNDYTSELTTAATSVTKRDQRSHPGQRHPGAQRQLDLLAGEVQQSTLGWTAAGAYYLEIAKLNAATLSLLNATPVTTSPTYDGLGPALSYDLAPLESPPQKSFMTTLQTVVQHVRRHHDADRRPDNPGLRRRTVPRGRPCSTGFHPARSLATGAATRSPASSCPARPNLDRPVRRPDVAWAR